MPIDFKSWDVKKLYEEKYDRETLERIKWFEHHEKESKKRAVLPADHKGHFYTDIVTKEAEISMPAVTTMFINSSKYRRQKIPIDGPILGLSFTKDSKYKDLTIPIPTESNPKPVMKPLKSKEQNLLYQDEPYCRYEYLKARKRKLPEEKYYFCETTSGEYGWRLGDSTIPVIKSKYKRFSMFNEKSRSKAGARPDPAYYQQPLSKLYFRCPQT